MKRNCTFGIAVVICTLALGAKLPASIVVGGSALLTQSDADQLEAWLGEGPVTITKIYAKQSGDTAAAFHAAVDGMGRAFTVIEVLANSAYDIVTGQTNNPRQIIGGYNPQSWHSGGVYNITTPDADRTAFLFNLTSGEIQRQSLTAETGSYGQYQTFNYSDYGPAFGGGFDIWMDSNLTYGYTQNYSYGGTSFSNNILSGTSYYHFHVGYGAIEVFQIAAGVNNPAAPEPASLAVWSLLALGVGTAGCRRRVRS